MVAAPHPDPRMTRFDVLLAVTVVIISVLVWGIAGRTSREAPWPGSVDGLAFSAYRHGQDPARDQYPELDTLREDLRLVATRTRAVRTYGVDGTLALVPALAGEHGLEVTAGVDLGADIPGNDARIRRLAAVVEASRNVARVIVGNEAVLDGRLTVAQVVAALDAARARIAVPVSTAEPWHVWLRNPRLAAHVDFITVHLLPYWEGVPVDDALAFVDARMADLARAFPGKPILIGEVGWPSRGRDRAGAEASPADQARFLSRFLARAEAAGWDYFLMEAFDQPWKRRHEGGVGAHWGVWNVDRAPKLDFAGTVEPLPHRWLAALATAALALAAFAALRRDGASMGRPGRALLATAALTGAGALVWTVHAHMGQYWTVPMTAVAVLVGAALLGALAVLLVEAHEWAEARWRPARRHPAPHVDDGRLPMVSLHLPVCNEPPEMVRETLRALAALDYPRLEVLVIDNNTRDEALWRPVEAACAALGERFRFFHQERLPGFKAGALNHTLARTAPDASVIAVIDADYLVAPGWLRAMVPHFADRSVAIVQSPQDYRDGAQSAFKAMCHAEYRGFFRVGMVIRDARNAIIQHGTMTLVRRSALEAAGGWGEWTITEDAELGLRLMANGARAVYLPASHGRGLTPDNFLDYKRQRLRWALGAVQILRRHRATLLSRGPGRLTAAQRFHFVAGWLPWLADGANLVLVAGAMVWSTLMILAPRAFEPPIALLSAIPVGLFTARLLKHAHLYRTRVGAGWRDTAYAALAGIALMPTAGLAVLLGTLGRRRPFLPTPKLARRHSVTGAIAAASGETATALGLLAVAAAAGTLVGGDDLAAWRLMLVVMCLPFAGALVLSLVSALPGGRRQVASSAAVPETS